MDVKVLLTVLVQVHVHVLKWDKMAQALLRTPVTRQMTAYTRSAQEQVIFCYGTPNATLHALTVLPYTALFM